jgi:hypothetical protein
MATKILIVKAEPNAPFQPNWPGAETLDLAAITALLPTLPKETTITLLAPKALQKSSVIQGYFDAGFPLTCLFFQDQEQANQYAQPLNFLSSESRTTGVKENLTKGSTIYTETFFNAAKVGERLDACYKFARAKIGATRSVEIWGAFHSLLFLGIHSLPEQGEKGTGERVDVQVGADSNCFAFSVRFDFPADKWPDLRRNALLEVPRSAIDFFELRYLQAAKKVEILGLCFLSAKKPLSIEGISFHTTAALEDPKSVKEYTFQGFGSLKGTNPEEKRVIKGGFKKKFSEQVSIKAGKEEAQDQTVITAEKVIDADNGNFLVKGEVLQPTPKVVVSGAAELGKKVDSETSNKPNSPAEKEKNAALWESKIAGLEQTLKQRDELVAKLNKEIEEIKDPMKMGVISGIKDNQLEGLKGNIKRLEDELAESQGREKELLAVVDKAVQMKDDAVKRIKEMDTKLRGYQGGNNSKVVALEKQIDEQKRQNKELSKRITQLTEQIQATGKKVA